MDHEGVLLASRGPARQQGAVLITLMGLLGDLCGADEHGDFVGSIDSSRPQIHTGAEKARATLPECLDALRGNHQADALGAHLLHQTRHSLGNSRISQDCPEFVGDNQKRPCVTGSSSDAVGVQSSSSAAATRSAPPLPRRRC